MVAAKIEVLILLNHLTTTHRSWEKQNITLIQQGALQFKLVLSILGNAEGLKCFLVKYSKLFCWEGTCRAEAQA